MRFRTGSVTIFVSAVSLVSALNFGAGAQVAQAQQAAQILNPEIVQLDVLEHQLPRVYQDQSVVRVHIKTLRQLRAALSIAESSWTERPGIGDVVLQVRTQDIVTLRELGLDPIVQIEDLQADLDEHWTRVQQLEARDRRNGLGAHALRRGGVHDDTFFENFKQYNEILAYFENLISVKPGVISKASIGSSVEGRDIWAYTITAPDIIGNSADDRPVILYNGTQHAREWISPMTVTYIASKLVELESSDASVSELLEQIRFVIVPVLNPDGYLYTWSDQRLWRKNRRDNPGTSSEGVDLNRNWGVEFGGQGADNFPSSDLYHGPNAFSEPETSALRDLAISFGDDLVAHIDYHAFSQLILWPLGYASNLVTPEPDRSKFESISEDMSALIDNISGETYDPIQSWRLYPAAGTCTDWFYADRGVTSFTVELRPSSSGLGGFAPPPSEILPTAVENFEASKLFAFRAGMPLSFEHDPAPIVDADQSIPVSVEVRDGFASLSASSVTLWTRTGTSGAFTPESMSAGSGVAFEASIAPQDCGDIVEYYFSAETTDAQTLVFPSSGEIAPFVSEAQVITIAFDDNMESDTGWSVGVPSDDATTGIWERGDPQGTDAQPENDNSPDGTLCWVTGASSNGSNGANDVDSGKTTLTSPRLDASGSPETELIYSRWYSNNKGAAPNADTMQVLISDDDGATWTTLEDVTQSSSVWNEQRFRIADFVSPTDEIRVRFVASDEAEGSLVEAGVDDLRVEAQGCLGNDADLTGDGFVDFADVSEFLTRFAQGDLSVDFDSSGSLDFADVSAFLALFSATP